MSVRLSVLPLLMPVAALCATPWNVARDEHLAVYSHESEADARAALLWFQQLDAILARQFDAPRASRPVFVFRFGSAAEYEPYRLRATADAYYVGTDERDYIVMAAPGPENFATAAHEYAHLALHRSGAHLPPWFAEGLADVFSTIRITAKGAQLSGEPAGRLWVLRNRSWLPLETLMSMAGDSPMRNTREGSDIFYAESWALTEMLLRSPAYAPRFRALATALGKEPGSSEAVIERTYFKPFSTVTRDLQAWVRRRRPVPVPLETGPGAGAAAQFAEAPDFSVRLMLGGMLLAAGDLDAAEAIYRAAALEAPGDATVLGGLASLSLAKGTAAESRKMFAEALADGLADANLCYRYAVLLDRFADSLAERRAALERAVEVNPAFDDARYALALLEKNSGNDPAAVEQLKAMRQVSTPRAYHYWFALADALAGCGRTEEAIAAARKAAEFAADADERSHALRIIHMAQTHMGVRFTLDAEGRQQLVTTRVANGDEDWNPFIEPTDDLRHVQGTLLEVNCSGPVMRMVIGAPSGRITVAIPDPTRVQMRNAPSEFTCGPQAAMEVRVDYAARREAASDGIARGMVFRQ